ncbi:ABC transporter permease [Paenibacillus glycinis]|uniref:ABC transporter permease subunit n=1 Tax=Paenibacillus glycinis TaxID=2697035 RepID=A0ABW9XKR3_9BACL|nr:ABC transporter permease subunit [Paenibacillus glycinis]NBD23151.1 ABC transporter permease subunit [Paenibacillus glycinis]
MNKTLFAGLFITLVIMAAALFGKYFAPHDLNESQQVSYHVDPNGESTLIVPPTPPSGDYPFGTDKYGYDMMAKLLAGAPYTIFGSIGVAFARLAIGGTLGLMLGFFGQPKKCREGRFSIWNLLNGIPIFIIVWMIMIGITMNPLTSTLKMTLILTVVLALAGIPSVASTMREKAMVLREKQFVLSAKSIGASPWTIVRTHIFPHMKESFIILFVQEIVIVLGLFGQLAIFDIFLGGTKMTFDPVEYSSLTNEWSGLIGAARDNVYMYQWVLFIPLAAYILFILGFHLISVGLEQLYRKRFAKVSQI